jgi:hypothetical protein
MSESSPSRLRVLRDTAVLEATHALRADDWRTALTCLRRAEQYELQIRAIERGKAAPPPWPRDARDLMASTLDTTASTAG